jgi:prephenate dehydratase
MSHDEICVCVFPGSSIDKCQSIMSDIVMLNTCENFIIGLEAMRSTSYIQIQPVWNSPGACHTVQSEQARNIAVIASTKAAISTDLTIVQRLIPNKQNHVSRHLIIALENRNHIGRATPLLTANGIAMINEKATILITASKEEQCLQNIMRVFIDLDTQIIQVQNSLQEATHKYVNN